MSTLQNSEQRYLEALGHRIRELRTQRHLGLQELADRARLHRTHLWKLEKGTLNPGIISYLRLSQVLGVSLSALLPTFELEGTDGDHGQPAPPTHIDT